MEGFNTNSIPGLPKRPRIVKQTTHPKSPIWMGPGDSFDVHVEHHGVGFAGLKQTAHFETEVPTPAKVYAGHDAFEDGTVVAWLYDAETGGRLVGRLFRLPNREHSVVVRLKLGFLVHGMTLREITSLLWHSKMLGAELTPVQIVERVSFAMPEMREWVIAETLMANTKPWTPPVPEVNVHWAEGKMVATSSTKDWEEFVKDPTFGATASWVW